MITCIDTNNKMIVSGSKDNLVKVWNIEKQKGYSFGKHMN